MQRHVPFRRLCGFPPLSLAVCLSVLPVFAAAQVAPIVEITPHYALIGATQSSIDVGIYWCSPDGSGGNFSQTVTVVYTGGSQDVTSSFWNDSWQHPAPSYCQGPNDGWEHWSGSVSLGPGDNTVTATAISVWNYAGSDVAMYNRLIPKRSVIVVAEGAFANVPPSSTGNVRAFTVTNTGEAQETFNLSRSCSGAATCTGSSPSQLTLSSGASGSATITYTAGSTVGSTGSVDLTATNSVQSTVKDAAGTEIVVQAASSPGVLLAGGGDVRERDVCLTVSAGSDIAYECGDLRVVHALPTVRTMNKGRTPVLHFNSQHANPYPLVNADVTFPSGDALPTTVQATLFINGVSVQQTWNGSDWGASGNTRRIAIGVDASSYATGLYSYQLEIRRITGGSNVVFQTVSGQLPIVNLAQSPFGAGWWLAGLERLYFPGDGSVFWVGGDGSTRRYNSAGTNVWLAANVDRPDSLTWDGTYYHRLLPNNLRVRFDASGLHVKTINRLSHETSFSYTTIAGRIALSTITLPTVSGSVSYTFQYNGNGQLTSVLSPGAAGSRTTTITVNTGNGRIDQIRDPDNACVNFGYDATVVRRMTSRTDRRSFTTSFLYDAGGRLTRHSLSITGATIAQDYRPMETAGLPGTVRGSAQPVDSSYTMVDGPRTDVTDISKFWFTRFGTLERTQDPLGRGSKLTYGNATFPGLVTELRDPAWLVTKSWYNIRGLTDSSKVINPLGTSVDATTRITWHGTWAAATQITSPEGVVTSMDYYSNGNRAWQQVGPSDTTRVSFTYHSATGLLWTVTAPGTFAESFTYDGTLGNLQTQTAPSGTVTTVQADALGRDTLVVSPIDASHSGWLRSTYDLMDQVTRTVSFGPATSGASADSIVVQQQYDGEGNVTQVTRTRGVAFAGYGPLTSNFTYDGAGRKTQEVNTGRTENYVYDLAGNTTQRQTTHGTTVMTYDAAGQLTRRITPAVTYGQTACNVFFTTEYCLYSFPTFGGSSVCVSADTAYFAYDSRGQVKAADNIHARIRRTYKPNGLLHSDTLRVRTYYSMAGSPCETAPNPGYIDEFGRHVYTLTYVYNRDGQRTSLSHPGGTQSYSYGAGGRGLLTGITDFESRSYTIDYDASGRVRVVHYPGGVNESRTYGSDGRMSVRDVTGVIHDQLTYDRQNRITSAYNLYRGGSNSDQTASTEYSGLGAVVSAGNYGGQSGWAETFTVDALGNRLRRQQQGMRPPTHPDSWGIRHSTYDSDARLTSVKDTVLSGYDPYIFEEYYWYDGAGNTDIDFLHETDFYGSGTFFEATKHYYGADEKLRVLNRHGGLGTTSDDSRPGRRGAFEEYRYDALGRRVLVRSRHGTACFTSSAPIECAQYLERTVWDGDQVLIEYRADGSDDGVSYEFNETSDGDAYGRIVYTHAFGIDQPLSVSKGGVAVMPHANWRGQYEVGTLASGASTTTCTGAPGCPRIDWPGAVTALDGSKTNPGYVYAWYGSLIPGTADGSGLMYMRNRYYDPRTGRFTQQDPIGLAGGLNAYGFASGDPVNYSDPLGLSPPGKLIKLGVKAFKTLIKGLEEEALIRNVREGEDVIVSSQRQASRIAREADPLGRRPVGPEQHRLPGGEEGRSHYHVHGRTNPSHIFFSVAAGLTVSHYAEGASPGLQAVAAALDFFNPLAAPQDLIDIYREMKPIIERGSGPVGPIPRIK